MNDFEREFEERFPAIRSRIGAFLFRLFPPIRCVGNRGTMPVFAMTGRALFDVAGWLPIVAIDSSGYRNAITQSVVNYSLSKAAMAVGVELKSTKQRHTSLPIIGADGSGSGLQAHQLEALAALHRDGGVARVLWSNGGIAGVLDGDAIGKAFYDYGVSLHAEKMRKTPAKGSRSIHWSLFRRVDLTERPWEVIEGPVLPPTMKQDLERKRKKVRKQLEEASKEQQEEADAMGFGGKKEEDDE